MSLPMLTEIKDVRQFEDDNLRRWFTDEFFDLIVWYDQQERISGFQLCYDKAHNERALTWRLEDGYSHTRIDDGEIPGQIKMTPILVPDGVFDKTDIAERFKEQGSQVDSGIVSLVYEKLLEFPGSTSGKRV